MKKKVEQLGLWEVRKQGKSRDLALGTNGQSLQGVSVRMAQLQHFNSRVTQLKILTFLWESLIGLYWIIYPCLGQVRVGILTDNWTKTAFIVKGECPKKYQDISLLIRFIFSIFSILWGTRLLGILGSHLTSPLWVREEKESQEQLWTARLGHCSACGAWVWGRAFGLVPIPEPYREIRREQFPKEWECHYQKKGVSDTGPRKTTDFRHGHQPCTILPSSLEFCESCFEHICRRKKTKDVAGDFSQEEQPRPGWMGSPFGQRRAIAGGCGILDISSLGT